MNYERLDNFCGWEMRIGCIGDSRFCARPVESEYAGDQLR